MSCYVMSLLRGGVSQCSHAEMVVFHVIDEQAFRQGGVGVSLARSSSLLRHHEVSRMSEGYQDWGVCFSVNFFTIATTIRLGMTGLVASFVTRRSCCDD